MNVKKKINAIFLIQTLKKINIYEILNYVQFDGLICFRHSVSCRIASQGFVIDAHIKWIGYGTFFSFDTQVASHYIPMFNKPVKKP